MEPGDVARVYGRVAGRYATTFADELDGKPGDRRLLDELVVACRGRGPVLDVGCGPGHVARYLHDRGVTAVGLDLVPAMAAEARGRHPDVGIVVADLQRLPIPDRRAAGVVAFYSLIHLARPALAPAARELRRVLRPGGVLLVAVHAGVGDVHADEFLGEAVAVDATLFSPAELTTAIEASGCIVDEVLERAPYAFEHPTRRLYVRARAPQRSPLAS